MPVRTQQAFTDRKRAGLDATGVHRRALKLQGYAGTQQAVTSRGMKQNIVEKAIRTLPFDGNEQSWHEWSAKFIARADMLGLLPALTQDNRSPTKGKEESSEESEDGYDKHEYNKTAYNQLILCCEGRAFNIVNNAKSEKYPRGDAALAWENLKRRYQIETAAGKMELKLKFASSRLRRDQDPDEWLLELELLRICLADMGSPITEEDFITHAINNLTQDYSELVTSLESDLEGLKIEILKERIMSFHRRKSTGEYTELNHIRSNSRKQKKSFNNGTHPKMNGATWKAERNQCYWCLRLGHTVKDCERCLAGESCSRRPDGTYYIGNFLWLKTYVEGERAHTNTVYAPGERKMASASLLDWHETLGHCNPTSILYLGQRGLINVTGNKKLTTLNCRLRKEYKLTVPHYQRGTRSPKRPGDCIHIDLVRPFTPDIEGHTYMIVAIDEATRYKRVYGLKNRAESHTRLKNLRDDFTTDGVNIITIRGDGAGELGRSTHFRKELGNLGIKWESTPPYTHQQNGLAERAIRQISEGGRVQLARANLGDEFWFSACKDFTAKSNLIPHQGFGGDTPFERIHPERIPRYQGVRKFGQTAYVHIDRLFPITRNV